MSIAVHAKPLDLSREMRGFIGRHTDKSFDWDAFPGSHGFPELERAQMRYIGAGGSPKADDPSTLENRFVTITDDVIPVLRQFAGLAMPTRGKRARGFAYRSARQFDLVVLDPPRWAKGKYGAVDVVRDYSSLFKPALFATAPGGTVLATNHVPEVERDAWLASLERCAAKAGRPLASIETLMPEEDFPSPDGRHPLKIALAHLPR